MAMNTDQETQHVYIYKCQAVHGRIETVSAYYSCSAVAMIH